jgi:hypothetical protein
MASHTASGEWQSFEIRMRRRRAERLALRAEVAAMAGFPEEAQGHLAEARTLAPDLPELLRVERSIASAPQAPADNRGLLTDDRRDVTPATVVAASSTADSALRAGSGWRWKITTAVAAALMLLAAVPFAPPLRNAAAPATPETATLAAVAPPSAAPASVADAPASAAASPDVATPAGPSAVAPIERAVLPSAAADTARRAADAPPLPAATPPSALTMAPAVPASVIEPVVAPREPAEPPTVPVTSLTSAGLAVDPSSIDPPPAEPAQEPLVRGALNRYAAAYNTLDAAAAQRVWPGVNRAALTRAFEGLSAQSLSLGDCRVDVTGRTARATCAGTASWTPRVGAGSQTESRVWSFALERTGENWQIVSARVQNR